MKCRHIVGYTIIQAINNQAINKRYLNHLAERLIIKWLISLFTFLISCY